MANRFLSLSLRNWLWIVALLFLASILTLVSALTLRWRPIGDNSLFLYYGYLIDHFHRVPYRDFFDNNAPGAYFPYLLIQKIAGFDNPVGFQLDNLIILAILLLITWLWQRQLGMRVALLSVLVFGIMYLWAGPDAELEREFLTLIPISLSLLIAIRLRTAPVYGKVFAVAVLFGLAATVKPFIAIGLPFVILFIAWDHLPDSRSRWRYAAAIVIAAALGLGVVGGVFAVWLWSSGAWPSFMEMATRYWPLYNDLDGELRIFSLLSVGGRVLYLARTAAEFHLSNLLFIPAILGALLALFRSSLVGRERRQLVLLITLTIVYAIYPILTIKMWTYHWDPYIYFAVLLSGCCLLPVARQAEALSQRWSTLSRRLMAALPWLAACAFIVVIGIQIYPFQPANQEIAALLQGAPSPAVNAQYGRIGAITSYLTANTVPGDKVQPLDFVGGALQAMLGAQVDLATPFVFDLYFQHHITNPYILSLRQRFIAQLTAAAPRFIVLIDYHHRPHARGLDTSLSFDALDQLLADQYSVAVQSDEFVIYKRRS